MRKTLLLLCTAILAAAPVSVYGATLLVSPFAPVEATLSFDVTEAQVRYRTTHDRFYIHRSIQSLTWGYESFFATLGYVSKTDFNDYAPGGRDPQPGEEPDSEPGYVLALGARGAVWQSGPFSALVHAQLHALNERVVWNDTARDLQSLEVLVGADMAWAPEPFALYAGFEVVPYSDFEMEIADLEGIERTDFIVGRAGGRLSYGPLSLSAELPFIGAEGVRVGLGFAF